MFEVGDQVIYIPNHANGDKTHKDCQRGVVSSVRTNSDNTQTVFVRYTEGSTGANTPTKNLHKI